MPVSDPLLRNAWTTRDTMSYGVTLTPKRACSPPLLNARETHGERRHGPRHPDFTSQRFPFPPSDSNDFLKVVNEVSGRDFTSLFESVSSSRAQARLKVDAVDAHACG